MLLLLVGCASTGGQQDIRSYWRLPDATWQQAATTGINLRSPDGANRFVPSHQLWQLVNVRGKLQQASGVQADLAVVDTASPNAFAFHDQGRPVVAFSLSWLEQLGHDGDAVAAVMGHELAHLRLGHTGAAREEREATATGISQLIGTVLNAAGIPLGGVAASVAVTGISRSFTRDEERAADALGLRWATAAGYNPCGQQRVMAMYMRLRGASLDLPFLSTHPGLEERAAAAGACQ